MKDQNNQISSIWMKALLNELTYLRSMGVSDGIIFSRMRAKYKNKSVHFQTSQFNLVYAFILKNKIISYQNKNYKFTAY